MTFTVERITRAHLAEVAELERLCFHDPWSERSLELLLGSDAVGYVCVSEGRVLAYGGMMLVPDEGQITNIATHPDVRRMGMGRAVVEALIDDAKKRGLEQLSLEVRVSNTAAVALYEDLGFGTAGRRKSFYRKPTEDAWVMIKALSI